MRIVSVIFYVICQMCIYRSIKFRIIECLSNNEVISAGNQGRFCSVIFGGLGEVAQKEYAHYGYCNLVLLFAKF